MKKDKEIWEPIFTKFPDSTKVPEVYHPTEETDEKDLDLQHKVYLAEGTLQHIEEILNTPQENTTKIIWIKNTMKLYHKNYDWLKKNGYLSFITQEENE